MAVLNIHSFHCEGKKVKVAITSKAGGGDAKGTPDEETEDPIMKAEREFFEIIKKVRVLAKD